MQEKKDYDEDYSSDDKSTDVYTPRKGDTKLEYDEEAYNLLEYFDLEWPSQSVAMFKDSLFVATNPPDNKKDKAELVKIELHPNLQNLFKSGKLLYKRVPTRGILYNSIRVFGDYLYCVSDELFDVYDLNLFLIESFPGSYSYALFPKDDFVYLGDMEGNLIIFNIKDMALIYNKPLHSKSINDVVVDNKVIYTISDDGKFIITDSYNYNVIKEYDLGLELNVIAINDSKVVIGTGEGKIVIYDKNSSEIEYVEKHLSPIEVVKFINSSMFVTGSEEQLCIWDLDIDYTEEDEELIQKYLLFVHQGQMFYKDVCLYNETILISTSNEGICLFTPISLLNNE